MATAAGVAPAATSALSRRRAWVVRHATRRRPSATSSAPQRSTTSGRTSGVTFSAGCRPRSSISSTSCSAIAGSVVNGDRDVDIAGRQRLEGKRASGSSGDEPLELQAVGLARPGRHAGRQGPSGGPPGSGRGRGHVAQAAGPPRSARAAGSDERVGVLRWCWGVGLDAGGGRGALTSTVVGSGDVAAAPSPPRRSGTARPCRRTRAPARSVRTARAGVRRLRGDRGRRPRCTGTVAALQRLAVDLGQHRSRRSRTSRP